MSTSPALRRTLVASSLLAAIVGGWEATQRLRMDLDDRNRDGRPDVWARYDEQGALSRIDFDTNFDGAVDLEEFYDRGKLVRREVDRDFDDRIDLVEEIDQQHGGPERTVVDVDFDGRADLLILFAEGHVVATTWLDDGQRRRVPADAVATSVPGIFLANAAATLRPFDDPFRGASSLRGRGRASPPNNAGTIPWLCPPAQTHAQARTFATRFGPLRPSEPRPSLVIPRQPRGPPRFVL